jgi:predicted Mrr-cat superfamily restriction endonuclease
MITPMPQIFVVRAEYGMYAKHFVTGGYAGIGWLDNTDLSSLGGKDELYPLYTKEHPADTSKLVIGQQVGQIARFLFDIKAGDYVITPDFDTELLHVGIVEPDPSYFYSEASDGCPYHHRRRVKWLKGTFKRQQFSVPFQSTIRSTLTVFKVDHAAHFFEQIGKPELAPKQEAGKYDPYGAVLNRLVGLEPREFEILTTHLLVAMGFEGAKHTGKPGDRGVDVYGELNIANIAKVKLVVQVKRYGLDKRVLASEVKELRSSIQRGAQGAFFTTAEFQKSAHDIANDPEHPRIGLINGRQYVDLLVEHWAGIPDEFRQKLQLRPGLVLE